jgi:hypothetical protein
VAKPASGANAEVRPKEEGAKTMSKIIGWTAVAILAAGRLLSPGVHSAVPAQVVLRARVSTNDGTGNRLGVAKIAWRMSFGHIREAEAQPPASGATGVLFPPVVDELHAFCSGLRTRSFATGLSSDGLIAPEFAESFPKGRNRICRTATALELSVSVAILTVPGCARYFQNRDCRHHE